MCIITAEEEEAERQYWLKVSKTNIFARHTRPGYQAIAYSLSIASRTRAAMILPLPVVPGSGEDALRFIDLSAYPDFFDDLPKACVQEIKNEMESFDLVGDEPVKTLAVHEVGDFEASFVPTMSDFDRLGSDGEAPSGCYRSRGASRTKNCCTSSQDTLSSMSGRGSFSASWK